ncbi:uncharacterized protein LOC120334314 [Styela clava]
MEFSVTFTFLSLMIITKYFGIDGTNHFICKTIAEAFGSENQIGSSDTDSTIRHIQGRPGKRGIQGMKGEIGPPGNVNFEAINFKLENKVNQMQETMGEYGSSVAELQAEVGKLKQRQDLCKVSYADKCFWFILHRIEDVTASQIDKVCAQEGGTPANIYGKNHFEEIDAYVDSIFPVKTFWTGMTINSKKIVTMNNGIRASWTVGDMIWFPGYPSNNADWTDLAIRSGRDTGDSQGMHNFPKHYTRHGVLCEK